jgi:hypothetical protein|tara:strand:- start:1223 stop:1327 length:105 start_codon:yes stop_codon:yes gene_type:complete
MVDVRFWMIDVEKQEKRNKKKGEKYILIMLPTND